MAFASSTFLVSTALLVLFLHSVATQNIPVGASITASQNSTSWRSSPNGDFAFGFQPLQANNSLFLLSIWFDKIPNKPIVWYDRTSYPVPRGSTLRLDTAGLILGDRLLYNSTGGGPVAYAFLNDTGNLVISQSDSSILWESFRHPSDTILPTQTIEINDTLISRKTEADFSTRRFFASISGDGDFRFNIKSVPTNLDYDIDYYYSSGTSSQNAADPGVRVVFSNRALISLVRRSGAEQLLSDDSIPFSSDNYYRAVLGFDGVFRQYYHPKNFGNDPTTSWRVSNSLPNNICAFINEQHGRGACGYNNVCRIEDQTPVCQCPPGFTLICRNFDL